MEIRLIQDIKNKSHYKNTSVMVDLGYPGDILAVIHYFVCSVRPHKNKTKGNTSKPLILCVHKDNIKISHRVFGSQQLFSKRGCGPWFSDLKREKGVKKRRTRVSFPKLGENLVAGERGALGNWGH